MNFLLYPLSLIYNLYTSFRNFLFDLGIIDSIEYKIPTIGIGNLSTGGTGKSIVVDYIISKFKNKNKIRFSHIGHIPPLSAQTLSLFIHVFIYLHLAMPAAACERRTGSRSLSVTETQGASRDFWKKPLAPFLSPVSSAASPA